MFVCVVCTIGLRIKVFVVCDCMFDVMCLFVFLLVFAVVVCYLGMLFDCLLVAYSY